MTSLATALSLAPSLSRESLALRYSLSNPFEEAIYVRNWIEDLYGLTGDPANADGYTRGLAWVTTAGDGALFFSGDIPKPPGPSPYAQHVPLATRIEAHASFEGSITARLPLVEWSPYVPPRAEPVESVEIRKVFLRLEYLLASSCRSADEHPNFKGAYRAWGSPDARFEAESRLERAVPLQRRSDAIWRPSPPALGKTGTDARR